MERMDKVLKYGKTDEEVIIEFKRDGEKYRVTTPLYLKDGSKNPQAEEYLDLYYKNAIGLQKKTICFGGITLAVGVLCSIASLHTNYKLMHEPGYFQEHFNDVDNIGIAGIGGGIYASLGSIMAIGANERKHELEREQKSRK